MKVQKLINNDNNIIKFTLSGRGKVAWKDTVAIVLLYKTRLKQSNGTHTLVIGRTKSGKKVEAKFVQHFPPNRISDLRFLIVLWCYIYGSILLNFTQTAIILLSNKEECMSSEITSQTTRQITLHLLRSTNVLMLMPVF